jgi:DNA modification methylase
MSWKDKFPSDKLYFSSDAGILYNGDTLQVLKTLPSESVDTVITSPPYWMKRDYGVKDQIGLEPDFHEYLNYLWAVFDEVYRILKPEGTLWVNIDDTYFSKIKGTGGKRSDLLHRKGLVNFQAFDPVLAHMNYPDKSLCLIPHRFAIGMVDRKWILRGDIIWHKPNALPSSVKDRFTVDYEHILFFVKQRKYYFKQQFEPYAPNSDAEYRRKLREKKRYAVKSSYKNNTPYMHNSSKNKNAFAHKRNKRSVWNIPTKPFKGDHIATFPPELPQICIDAGCPESGIVMDPFMGSGTTAVVATKMHRKWIGIEINTHYCDIIKERVPLLLPI